MNVDDRNETTRTAGSWSRYVRVRQLFLDRAFESLREMRQLVASGEWSEVSNDRERVLTLAHQLKGSGGSHGYPEVSSAARRFEDILRGDTSRNALHRELSALRRHLECARPGSEEWGIVEVKGEHPRVILVVEDDPSISLLVELSLEDLGYQVETIADGTLALRRLEARSAPDLIVLDLMLPGASGLEIVQAVRRRPEMRELPIIVLSARTMPDIQEQTYRHGAQVFLEKPFRLEELHRHIRERLTEV